MSLPSSVHCVDLVAFALARPRRLEDDRSHRPRNRPRRSRPPWVKRWRFVRRGSNAVPSSVAAELGAHEARARADRPARTAVKGESRIMASFRCRRCGRSPQRRILDAVRASRAEGLRPGHRNQSMVAVSVRPLRNCRAEGYVVKLEIVCVHHVSEEYLDFPRRHCNHEPWAGAPRTRRLPSALQVSLCCAPASPCWRHLSPDRGSASSRSRRAGGRRGPLFIAWRWL